MCSTKDTERSVRGPRNEERGKRNTREGSTKLRKRERTLLYGGTEGKSSIAIRGVFVEYTSPSSSSSVRPIFILFLALLSFIRVRSVVRTRNQPVFSASVLPQSISGS